MPRARLLELYAAHVGVIDEVRIEFAEGFNVITGETGAGKTLLLDALGLALGDEGASRRGVREGSRAVALFDVDGRERQLSRELSDAGRLRGSLDASPASAEALRAEGERYVAVHGQHDALRLRSRSEVLRRIDDFGGVDDSTLRSLREEMGRARSELERLGGDEASRERELDFLHFQLAEFERVAIADEDELVRTLSELERLSAIRDAQVALLDVVDEFDGDRDDAILTRFASTLERLRHVEALASELTRLRDALESARQGVRELAHLADPEAVDEEAMARLDERASVLSEIARKHGGTLTNALAAEAELRSRLEELDAGTARAGELHDELARLENAVAVEAQRVRAARLHACGELNRAVERELPRVALAGATVRFGVDGEDGSAASVTFRAKGSGAEGPLDALASGGELSRVLLAIALVSTDEESVAVFDEIDAGLGGVVAQQIGECLDELGRRQQVLAVTHLASVAARADAHFVIARDAHSTVRRVEGEERVTELARMLAGEPTEESRSLARRLLVDATVRD